MNLDINPEKETYRANFVHICHLLLDFGRMAVLKILEEKAKPQTVGQLVLSCKSDFKKFKRKVLSQSQWKLLYPDAQVSKQWDLDNVNKTSIITLTIIL